MNKKKGIARIIEMSGEKAGHMILCVVLSSIGGLLLLSPYLSVYFILSELLKNIGNLSGLDGGYIIAWAFRGIFGLLLGYLCTYAGGMSGHIAAYRIICGTRLKLAEHIGKLPMGYFQTNAIGKTKRILEAEVEQIEIFIAHQVPDLICTVVTLVVMIVTMLIVNVWLTAACLVPIILGFFFMARLMGNMDKLGVKERADAAEQINASSVEYVKGMPAIKIFGQTVHSFQNFYDIIQKYKNAAVNMAKMLIPGNSKFQTLIMSVATFILPVGLLLVFNRPGDITIGISLVFFLVFAPGITAPLFKLINFVEEMTLLNENVVRIEHILELAMVPDKGTAEKPTGYDIVFENVAFSYTDDGKNAIEDISFTAPSNQITALVGPSGSGKSTIAQLIPRFWDVGQGKITVGGIDIRELPMSTLMNTISFVFQDSFLFSDTIYNNIAVGKPGASKAEVVAAAKAAQCDDFIKKFPKGYDTLIGSGGVYLSGGESQRLSVARAILKNAPILIMDEATAYADPENEYEMQLALQELIKGKTVLVIAHRLSTIKEANQILVIADGRIAEQGIHQALQEQNGIYKKMWDTYSGAETWALSGAKGGVQA